MLKGSCLCGAVRYEVRGPVSHVTHCHCAMCRKAHGAAFGSYGRVERTDFVVLSGALTSRRTALHRRSSTFCKRCGSTLQFISDKRPDTLSVALGTLDDDPRVRTSSHIFVASKAPWYQIAEDLPQHPARPPSGVLP